MDATEKPTHSSNDVSPKSNGETQPPSGDKTTSPGDSDSVVVIQQADTEGTPKDNVQGSATTIKADMLDSSQVVLVQAPADVALSELASNFGNELQNVQIIIDFDGNQILLTNEENEEVKGTLQQFEITDKNEVLSSAQIQEIQKLSEGSTEEQQTSASEEGSSNVPVLFLVRAEDGSFHNVNMDIEKSQPEKVVSQTSASKESEPSPEVAPKPGAEQERPFQCDLCSATFTRLGNYTRHRMIHTIHIKDDHRYKCEVCGHMFLQRCDLKRHVLTHGGNLPYKCDQCGKGYVRKSDLVVHTRFHNNERSFACTLCPKAFYQSGDLQRHIRHVHQRLKPLTCGHCQRKYSKEATLIRHMQTVHRDIILKSLTSKVIQPTEEATAQESEVLSNPPGQQMDVSS